MLLQIKKNKFKTAKNNKIKDNNKNKFYIFYGTNIYNYSLSNEILNGLTLDLNIIFQIKLFK